MFASHLLSPTGDLCQLAKPQAPQHTVMAIPEIILGGGNFLNPSTIRTNHLAPASPLGHNIISNIYVPSSTGQLGVTLMCPGGSQHPTIPRSAFCSIPLGQTLGQTTPRTKKVFLPSRIISGTAITKAQAMHLCRLYVRNCANVTGLHLLGRYCKLFPCLAWMQYGLACPSFCKNYTRTRYYF